MEGEENERGMSRITDKKTLRLTHVLLTGSTQFNNPFRNRAATAMGKEELNPNRNAHTTLTATPMMRTGLRPIRSDRELEGT